MDDLSAGACPSCVTSRGRIRYRGKWDISIHGEQLKPIMAEKALESGADVYNRVTATALIMHEGRCTGAMGFGVRDGKFYIFRAKATVVSTGGAGTLYKSYTADSTDSGAQIRMCPLLRGHGLRHRLPPGRRAHQPGTALGGHAHQKDSAARWTPSPWATARPSSTRTASAS